MEVVKNIIEYIAIIMSAIILVYKTNLVLKYFQQSHYYFDSYKKTIRYYYFGKWQYFILGILAFVLFLDSWIVQVIYIVYLGLLLYFCLRKTDIIKLKTTPRIYRLYLTLLILGTIFSSTLLLLFDLPDLLSSLAIIIFVLPFLIFVSSLINHPIEKLISKYYQRKAKNILKKVNPLIIGITGSFGKTSTKNILYDLLKEKYITHATPKSYNTLNGVSLSINNDMTNNHEVVILEMGASRVGDIGDLVKLARPNYAVLTGVTEQHLESFKSIENILEEKMKIIESLDGNGIGFINGDDQLIASYKLKTEAKIIKFGTNISNDYYVSDIKIEASRMKFKIHFNNEFIEVETKLLGRHNILNILCAFAVARELGVKASEMEYQISTLEPVKHRLSIEESGGYTIIDDSFNSNKIGFINALEVLSYYPSPRVLITPGIVEAGVLEEEINYNLANKIVEVADEVILIETKASSYILKGLDDLGFKNLKVMDSFLVARKYVFDKYQKASILIENDVSDIYKI